MEVNIHQPTFTQDVTPTAPLKAVMFDDPHDNIDGIDVLTDVGGMSMFLEFDTGPSKEFLCKDMMLNDDAGDSVLTNVGDLSLFLEQPMNSLEELEGAADTTTGLGHAATGGQMMYFIVPLEEGNGSGSLILPWDPGKHDMIYIGPNESIQLVISRTPMKQRKKIVLDSLGHTGGGFALCLHLILHSKITIGQVKQLFSSMCQFTPITRP
jgi:hypothetical protein